MTKLKISAMFAVGWMAMTAAGLACAQLTLYEHDNYAGRVYRASRDVANLADVGFNDVASSAIVRNGQWQLCSDANFRGQCVTVSPGEYPSLNAMGLNDKLSSVREVREGRGGRGGGGSSARITLYEHDDFAGRSVPAPSSVANLESFGFNDEASSVRIREGQWQLCVDANYRGTCVTLGPGDYRSLNAMGMNDKVSSVREVQSGRGGWGGGGSGARITLYEHDDFGGRSVPASSSVASLDSAGFNDKASSVRIREGQWQLCVDADYRGTCVTLGPGDYRSLNAMGMNDKVSSVRQLGSAPGGGTDWPRHRDFKTEEREAGHCRLNDVALGRDFYNGRCTIKQSIAGDRTRFTIRMESGDPMVFVKRGGSWEYVNKNGANLPARFRDLGQSAVFQWENYRLDVYESR